MGLKTLGLVWECGVLVSKKLMGWIKMVWFASRVLVLKKTNGTGFKMLS